MMNLNRVAIALLILSAATAAAPAEAGRPRLVVLDQDRLSLTHDPEFETWASLSLLRAPSGEALLMDVRQNAPIRVTPLGLQVPSSGVFGSYVEAPDGTIWAAVASVGSLWLLSYDSGEGDTATHEHWLATDPASVHLGIIDVLIGIPQTPVPTLAVHIDGEIYGWVGGALLPIEQRLDGWHLAP